MSEHTENEQSEDGQTQVAVGTPGAMLREARAARHLSIDEMMGQTKLTDITLEALERDDFELLSEPVFIRGYYRKCAKILELNEEDLLAAYDAMQGGKPRTPKLVNLRRDTDEGVNWLVYLIYGLLGGLLVLLSIWWFTRTPEMPERPDVVEEAAVISEGGINQSDSSPDDSSDLPEVPAWARVDESEPESTRSGVDLALDDRIGAVSTSAAAEADEPANATAATPADDLVTEVSVAIDPPASAGSGNVPAPSSTTEEEQSSGTVRELKLQFNEESWVRIDDADKNRLLVGLISGNETRVMSGPAPFTIFLGNAPVVEVQIDGKGIDLAPYIQANRIARFEAGAP